MVHITARCSTTSEAWSTNEPALAASTERSEMMDVSPEERRMMLEMDRLLAKGSERMLELAKIRLKDSSSIPPALIAYRKYKLKKQRQREAQLAKRKKALAKRRKKNATKKRALARRRENHRIERANPRVQYYEWIRKVRAKWTKAGKPSRLEVLLTEDQFVDLVSPVLAGFASGTRDVEGYDNYTLQRTDKALPWRVDNITVVARTT